MLKLPITISCFETMIDEAKCAALKAELATLPEPAIIAVAHFFDGNDDVGSVGCNLIDHPGVAAFRATLVGLLQRPDVEAVYAQIAEVDPGEGSWPFTDTILVAGALSIDDLRTAVAALQPDEVATASEFGISSAVISRHTAMLVVWWD